MIMVGLVFDVAKATTPLQLVLAVAARGEENFAPLLRFAKYSRPSRGFRRFSVLEECLPSYS